MTVNAFICRKMENFGSSWEEWSLGQGVWEPYVGYRDGHATASHFLFRAEQSRTPESLVETGRPLGGYVDHSQDPINEDDLYLFQCLQGAEATKTSNSSKTGGKRKQDLEESVKLPFPQLLYEMLCESSLQGTDDIVSWTSHGRSFVVHNREEFVQRILPR